MMQIFSDSKHNTAFTAKNNNFQIKKMVFIFAVNFGRFYHVTKIYVLEQK